MEIKKSRFALFFGNRGFFPASLLAQARQELPSLLKSWGHEVLMLEEGATRLGAVETLPEGQRYASFLRENYGKFDGVILSLPNFGDEYGAVTALKDANVPILVHGYPDDMDKMDPAQRRDAFCGKISVMDVFQQYRLKYTALKPHVVSPQNPRFKQNVDEFDRICRVVGGVKGMVVGAIGARTTAFKTVRIDEVTLQRHGITVETLDLSDVIARVKSATSTGTAYQDKAALLKGYASWKDVPETSFDTLVKLGVVLDELVVAYQMNALSIRCWTEMQTQLGISPCVLLGELNNRLVSAACEVDTGNAIMMHALTLASGQPPALLDWNNNYAEEDNKCILFHCGPVPRSLMTDEGRVIQHLILNTGSEDMCSFGCHVGRIKPMNFTFGSLLTNDGRASIYVGQGRFTKDPIPPEFFGCAGVAEIERLQDVLIFIGRKGYRHHVSVTPDWVQDPLKEALGYYLNFEVSLPQKEVVC
jgi:L-fucose isomerase-like protein